MTVRCSSMCRWNGWTQPPPPFLISQRLKLFFFGVAGKVWPAGFFMLTAGLNGSKGLPLISHSSSPPALPRCTSKMRRFSRRLFQLLGSGGSSPLFFGVSVVAGALLPLTVFVRGVLLVGVGGGR